MRCPYCERDKDKVTDSRPSDSGDAIRRRRECLACGKRFTTYERVERTERLMVVKRDGTRVPFDPEKVMRGLASACGKRPVPADAKERLVREVEEEMHREYEREVPSLAIGKRVADKKAGVTEDQAKGAKESVDELTKQYTAKIDALAEKKIAEIEEV